MAIIPVPLNLVSQKRVTPSCNYGKYAFKEVMLNKHLVMLVLILCNLATLPSFMLATLVKIPKPISLRIQIAPIKTSN